MGHDIDIVDIETGKTVDCTYITGNFSKYTDEYPGIYAIHGHKNSTVIKIIQQTLNKLINDGICPSLDKKYSAWGSDNKDRIYDLECYYLCLENFLSIATKINNTYTNVYWYSDQVWEITKFKAEITNGYESDGFERPDYDSSSDD